MFPRKPLILSSKDNLPCHCGAGHVRSAGNLPGCKISAREADRSYSCLAKPYEESEGRGFPSTDQKLFGQKSFL